MNARSKPESSISPLVELLELSYRRKAWHGPNLRGSIRGINPETAGFRPAPQRRNIWEIVVHCAYWKYAAWRRLTGQKRGAFAIKGSNWFGRPKEATPQAWRADVRLLDEMHAALLDAVAALPTAHLNGVPPGCKVSNFMLIVGVASHDVYHTGQIQLLKRLAADQANRSRRKR